MFSPPCSKEPVLPNTCVSAGSQVTSVPSFEIVGPAARAGFQGDHGVRHFEGRGGGKALGARVALTYRGPADLAENEAAAGSDGSGRGEHSPAGRPASGCQ